MAVPAATGREGLEPLRRSLERLRPFHVMHVDRRGGSLLLRDPRDLLPTLALVRKPRAMAPSGPGGGGTEETTEHSGKAEEVHAALDSQGPGHSKGPN